jgi:hypothetical protein
MIVHDAPCVCEPLGLKYRIDFVDAKLLIPEPEGFGMAQ